MAGWQDFGKLLGGGVNTTDAYQRGQTKAAQLEQLIADAKVKRSKAAALDNMAGALVKLDMPADLATVLAAGYNPEQLSGYMGDVQAQRFRGDAASRALAGDWDGANAALMGVASGPQQLAKVEGQNLLDNVFLTGGGGITTTDQAWPVSVSTMPPPPPRAPAPPTAMRAPMRPASALGSPRRSSTCSGAGSGIRAGSRPPVRMERSAVLRAAE